MCEVMISCNLIVFCDEIDEFVEVEGLADLSAFGRGVEDHFGETD
jgi:hypothetical protein